MISSRHALRSFRTLTLELLTQFLQLKTRTTNDVIINVQTPTIIMTWQNTGKTCCDVKSTYEMCCNF